MPTKRPRTTASRTRRKIGSPLKVSSSGNSLSNTSTTRPAMIPTIVAPNGSPLSAIPPPRRLVLGNYRARSGKREPERLSQSHRGRGRPQSEKRVLKQSLYKNQEPRYISIHGGRRPAPRKADMRMRQGERWRLRRSAQGLRRRPVFRISIGHNPLKSLDSEK